MTQCNTKSLTCTPLLDKKLEFDFEGGEITTDAGAILLREVEKKMNLFDRVAEVLVDKRTSPMVVHSVRDMLAQRFMGLCLGYEDLNDHATLRNDPMMQIATKDRIGEDAVLATPSTLCRWERKVSRKELLDVNKM